MALAELAAKKSQQRYTAEEVAEAIELSKGLVSVAARRLGCSRETVRLYAKRYVSVQRAIADAREDVKDLGEARLFQAIDRGEAWAVCFFLKTQGRDRGYVERIEQEHRGSIGHYVVDISGNSDTDESS